MNEMGTELPPGTDGSDIGRGKERLLDEYAVHYARLVSERDNIKGEIKRLNKEINRCRTIKKALMEHNRGVIHSDDYVETMALAYEHLNGQMWEAKKKVRQKYDKLENYNLAIECIEFADSDWCQYLLMGNKLTTADIINEWNREAEKEYRASLSRKTKTGFKTSEDVIEQIIAMRKEGKLYREIASALNISVEPVRRYVKERMEK